MTKLKIDIPEDMNNRNKIFSYCLSFLRKQISENDKYEWVLKPLGNTELISTKNLLWLIMKKLDKPMSVETISAYLREYTRDTWIKIDPIKKYSKVADTMVYLKEDIDPFIDYILKKNKS